MNSAGGLQWQYYVAWLLRIMGALLVNILQSCGKSWNIPVDPFEGATPRRIKNNRGKNCIIALVIKCSKILFVWKQYLNYKEWSESPVTLLIIKRTRCTDFSNLFLDQDPASKQSAKPVWHIPIAVYTVLDSWRWTENLSETCGVLFQK